MFSLREKVKSLQQLLYEKQREIEILKKKIVEYEEEIKRLQSLLQKKFEEVLEIITNKEEIEKIISIYISRGEMKKVLEIIALLKKIYHGLGYEDLEDLITSTFIDGKNLMNTYKKLLN